MNFIEFDKYDDFCKEHNSVVNTKRSTRENIKTKFKKDLINDVIYDNNTWIILFLTFVSDYVVDDNTELDIKYCSDTVESNKQIDSDKCIIRFNSYNKDFWEIAYIIYHLIEGIKPNESRYSKSKQDNGESKTFLNKLSKKSKTILFSTLYLAKTDEVDVHNGKFTINERLSTMTKRLIELFYSVENFYGRNQ
jgi:hypothetical protein